MLTIEYHRVNHIVDSKAMSLSVLLVFLVSSGTVSLRGRWSVVASPVIIVPKTVDVGVKAENLKVEYCGEYCISILYYS